MAKIKKTNEKIEAKKLGDVTKAAAKTQKQATTI